MTFIRLALLHALAVLKANYWLLLLLAVAHLAANATFTGFAGFAFQTIFFGSEIRPEVVGIIANAPLTASLAVIVTGITFGTASASRLVNRQFIRSWIPVTVVFAWAYFFSWYARAILGPRIGWYITAKPNLTTYLPTEFYEQTIPWIANLLIAAMAVISVPVFVTRRAAFARHRDVLAPLIVVLLTGSFMFLREFYRDMVGDINPYQWLPFPGYHPAGIAYDHMIFALIEMPFLVPATVFVTCLTASLMIAIDQERALLSES